MDETLRDMVRSGKTESILRNAYTKYMCWLYYKFERIVGSLGAEEPPKILYDGDISSYELAAFDRAVPGGGGHCAAGAVRGRRLPKAGPGICVVRAVSPK